MDYVNTDIQVSTARQLAHIRNTINMMDEFYEAEMGYFHAWMPKYEILVKEMGTVILNSPFKKDMEEEFGSILIQNMEVGQLLSSEAVVDDMVKEADVVLENFKSGSIDRLGLGYEELKKINPKIVFVSLSGFGATGPLKKYPCYDAIAAARGGFAGSNGEPDVHQ